MAALQNILHVVSPASILTFYFGASIWETISMKEKEVPASEATESSASPQTDTGTESSRTSKEESSLTGPQARQRKIQLLLSLLTGLLYVGEAIALGFSSTPVPETEGAADKNIVFALFSSLVWLVIFLGLLDTGVASKGGNLRITWGIAAIFEVVVFCVGLKVLGAYSNKAGIAQVTLQATRIATEALLVASTYQHPLKCEAVSDEETAPLLVGGTTKSGKDHDAEDIEGSACKDMRPVRGNWWRYVSRFQLFLPIIRPETMQEYCRILGVMICIAVTRALNVAVPVILGAIVSALSRPLMPWTLICLYLGLTILESSAGIDLVKGLLWEPVEQRALQRMKRAAYDKLMSLSCDFHDNNKSDITFQTIQRGVSITNLVETIIFELLPMAMDLVISISVFSYLFNAYVGFVVAVVVVVYLSSTVKTLSTRAALWRQYIEIWNAEWYTMTESVKSWDAVSHFGRVPYEMDNFRNKTDATFEMTIKWSILIRFLNSSRSIILNAGLSVGTCLIAHDIIKEEEPDVGKFIVFITYWAQLSNPLHYFATSFNSIGNGLVNAEKLLSVFETQPTIQNAEEAVPFVLKQGAVDFKNVSFAYDGNRTVTNQVTFHAEPGKITAFVGETGCGKSTLFKLLFRFYDPKEGSICIDGQDIKELTLDSFREHLGIVPQEPALFNKSIRENLRYPDLKATDEEIEEACKAVSLHDKIMSFTKGYDEVIGERGTKLSGGEKQRVAIARAILKNPSILLLDEATSSVDSTTEAQIQASLKILCADRTTFVIAHRLSTIVNADQIIVMNGGKIVESGTHASLIKHSGPYNELWTSQLYNHISELRGRSKSRSGCGKEHLLWNDLNSSDDDAKILLAETIESSGFAVTNDQAKIGKQASSHKASHEKVRDRGRDSSRTDGVRTTFARSKSPRPPPLLDVLPSEREPTTPSGIIHENLAKDSHLQGEPEGGEPANHDHDLKLAHSSAEAASRRHQSTSEPTDHGPVQHDGSGDHRISIASGVNTKRRALKSKELAVCAKRIMSHTGISQNLTTSAESTSSSLSRSVQDRGSEGSKFKLRNGKISGGLKSVALGQITEKSAVFPVQDGSAESQATKGSFTPMLMVPTNSPAREASSPGGVSSDGGAALDSSPRKE